MSKNLKLDPKLKLNKGLKLNDSRDVQSSLFRDNNLQTALTKEASRYTPSLTTSKKSDRSHSNQENANLMHSQMPMSPLSHGLTPESDKLVHLRLISQQRYQQDHDQEKQKPPPAQSSEHSSLSESPIPEASESSSQISKPHISVIEDPKIELRQQMIDKKRSLDETKLSKIVELNYQ